MFLTHTSSVILIHNQILLPMRGTLEEIPVLGGAEIMIIFMGEQRINSEHTSIQIMNPHAPDVDQDGHQREESHGLYHARAPSQPGNNGGAAPDVDCAGQQREEIHGLYHARAPSVCCKQIKQAENMVQVLDFTCPRPYRMYTDSQACLKIATNASKMGMVRHLEIRYHLVRCVVLMGYIILEYCITEDMLADLFSKIVTTAQDKRLAVRFYNDTVMA
jgi:hypothetical protein